MASQKRRAVCPHCGKTALIRPDRTYCSATCARRAREAAKRWTTSVILGDIHIPFHDQRAVDLALQFIAVIKPDEIILNGDIADFYQASTFSRDPRRQATLASEITQVREYLGRLRAAAPKAKIIYISGNHEHRFHRFLIDKAPELVGLEGLTAPEQFRLADYKVEWVGCRADKFIDTFIELGPHLLVGHFAISRTKAGYTAANLLDRWGKSLIQAHVHSMGVSHKTYADRQVMAWEGGCLCDMSPHYCHPNKWMQGFTVVHREQDGGFFHVEQIPMINHQFFYGGRLYR